MSIIYDALQKVEDKKSVPGSVTASLDKHRRQFFIILAVSIFAIACFFSLLFLFASKGLQQVFSQLRPPQKKTSSSIPPPAPAKSYFPGTYKLEGIVYDQEVPIAIINGEMLKVGEKISNYEVIEITPTSVQLIDRQGDKKTTLTF